MSTKRVLYWFRNDLRLADSPALAAALSLAPSAFFPLWICDARSLTPDNANRWQFILDSVDEVSTNLTAVNPRQKLLVVRGPAESVINDVMRRWKISDLVWEKDDDDFNGQRDAGILSTAKAEGVTVHIVKGTTLYDSAKVIAKNKGTPSKVYNSFLKHIATLPAPPKPIAAPTSLPDPTGLGTENYSIPTMKDLGIVAEGSIRGGESRAHAVFEAFMADKKAVAMFQKPKTAPGLYDPPSTTQLSPHLRFGTLSVRTFYHRVMAINAQHKNASQPPESLIGQLLWREFFHINSQVPNFHQIKGNNVSRYIGWSLQNKYAADGSLLPRHEMEAIWQAEEPVAWEQLQAYKEGRTGFPWIDALMRQLRAEGWLHHLGRHSVACFLTRGQLYISWERGAEVFEDLLVDHDPSVNSANWMWLSASAFFVQYFRVYSPATYGQNTEKTGKLIRKYCPELSMLPDKFIYTPWLAPPAVLKTAKVVLGGNYPERMVDDKVTKEANLKLLKAAYAAKMQGDNPKVLNNVADAYVATFLGGGGAVKDEDEDEDDDEEDKKPVVKKRKAPAAAKDKVPSKQAKLAFAAKSEE